MTNVMTAVICPGQGAQAVGMGRAWCAASAAAKTVFDDADAILGDALGAPLSALCFEGPAERLNQTDVSQPAIFTCSIASWHGLREQGGAVDFGATAGLSLGEYTALCLGGVLDFETGLRLVALRGRLMQEAAEASRGGMVALIGADEPQAAAVCERVLAATVPTGGGTGDADAGVLVPANFNAPGQIVLSGDAGSCARALDVAGELGLRATPLTVAGAFHSPLMQPAADRMADALADVTLGAPAVPVWSNVTGEPHDSGNEELLKRRLVEQIVSPVRWSQGCQAMVARGIIDFHELAPGSVLRGLMRRIDRSAKVTNHDEPASP